jgi:hypothetical protein
MIIIIILLILLVYLLYFYNKEGTDYDKILFINKIDKERYIILKNCIKEFKKVSKNPKNKFDYLHDIYTHILEICYSLYVENLKPKNVKRLNNLIKYFRTKYYNDLLIIKKNSKNPILLFDYEVVPANYRESKNMLP